MANKRGADDPWLPLGVGAIVTVFSAGVAALTTDVVAVLAMFAAGIGAVTMLVGVIGLGVLIGGRALDDERSRSKHSSR